MISRRLFDAVGGYDEQYQLAFSDVTMCLRAWEKGYRIVYTPFASLIHHEGYSRGSNTPIPDFQHFASDFRETGLHPGSAFPSRPERQDSIRASWANGIENLGEPAAATGQLGSARRPIMLLELV